ncbi:MAG: GNAT family N-acetyltransferase [Spirochaetes bacterium]|nr:GNAT family N-acetyltransferase [Spirochaetota bacterium]
MNKKIQNFEIFDSFNKIKHLRNNWDQFAINCKSPVYMSFDWCRVWWDFYGLKKNLSIYLFYNNKKIVGILPVYFDKVWFGPIWLTIGRILGANIPPKVFNPPIKPEYIDYVVEFFFKDVFDNKKCDVFSFGPISKNYTAYYSLTTIGNNLKNLFSNFVENSYDPYTLFFLPDQYQNFFNSLNKRERKNFEYELRRLNREYKITIDVLKNINENEEDFNKFLEMHFNQWQEKGKRGHFQSWPDGEAFNKALSIKQSNLGRFRLIRIKVNDEVIIYQYGFKYGDCFYWQIPARSINQEYKKLSLGRIGVINMVETLINEGVKTIEAGLGHYDYKMRFGGEQFPTSIFRFTSKQLNSKIRSKIIRFFSFFFLFAYHKIWYRRIQPCLPKFFQKPIWKYWIRLNY